MAHSQLSSMPARIRRRVRRTRRTLAARASRTPVAAPPAVDVAPPAVEPVLAPDHWDSLAAVGLVSAGVGTYGHHLIDIIEFPAPDGTRVGGRITIGNYCSIAPCEMMPAGGHHPEWVTTWPARSLLGLPGGREDQTSRGDITIGHDVWIGRDSLIMSGVTVGHGAIIGARAVVTRDVRPYAVVVGNPAREVRRRFDDATVERLLSSRWWDWPEAEVRANVDLLCAPPDGFGPLAGT